MKNLLNNIQIPVAAASTPEFVTKLTDALNGVKVWGTTLGLAVAVVCVIFAGIQYMLGIEQSQKAKKWLVAIFVGCGVVILASQIIGGLSTFFG